MGYPDWCFPTFRDSDWIWGTVFQCFKEFLAVFFQLVCYARMGNYDFFNGALVLFVTLTVFAFPFLNMNLFALLRFGPWFKPSEQSIWGTITQTILIAGFQIAGASAAAAMWYDIISRWGSLENAVDNGILYNSSHYHGAIYNSLDSNTEIESVLAKACIFFDEFAAQLVLLISLIHILEACLPDLLSSALWQPKEKTNTEPTTEDANKVTHTPVPMQFILYVSVLIAGLTRAFPSAHQSPHVSAYLLVLRQLGMDDIDVGACWLRLFAGVFSTLFALMYYWFVYVDRLNNIGNYAQAIKNAVIVKPPAFTRSELLLPGVFKSS